MSKTGHLHVLVVFAPRSRKRVAGRYVSCRPWLVPHAGDVVLVHGARLLVVGVSVAENRIAVYTRGLRPRLPPAPRPPIPSVASNVVTMPIGRRSVVVDFLRYHVLVRVFNGDANAWLAHIKANGADAGDVRFARLLRTRLRADPTLISAIRRMVDATPLWAGVGA